jgi:hypothetical protein
MPYDRSATSRRSRTSLKPRACSSCIHRSPHRAWLN